MSITFHKRYTCAIILSVLIIGFCGAAEVKQKASAIKKTISTFIELHDAFKQYAAYEKRNSIQSQFPDALKIIDNLENQIKKLLTEKDWEVLLIQCEYSILPWLSRDKCKYSSPDKAKAKVKSIFLLALHMDDNSGAFNRAREFWLKIERVELANYSGDILKIIEPRLNSLGTIRLYSKLQLNASQKKNALEKIAKEKKLREPKMDCLSIRASLGDKKAEDALVKIFNKAIIDFANSTDFKAFRRIENVSYALGDAGTERCARALVGKLNSEKQHISMGSTSIRVPLLKSLDRIYYSEFKNLMGVRLSSWLETHGHYNAFTDEVKVLPECTDPKGLLKLEKFIIDNFKVQPWINEDVWFSFQYMIPHFEAGVKINIPAPKTVFITKNRKAVPYKK